MSKNGGRSPKLRLFGLLEENYEVRKSGDTKRNLEIKTETTEGYSQVTQLNKHSISLFPIKLVRVREPKSS